MDHLKLVDQKMIIIVLVLLYFLNLKKVEFIPVIGHLPVSLCFDFFCNPKEWEFDNYQDQLSSNLQVSSRIVYSNIRQDT